MSVVSPCLQIMRKIERCQHYCCKGTAELNDLSKLDMSTLLPTADEGRRLGLHPPPSVRALVRAVPWWLCMLFVALSRFGRCVIQLRAASWTLILNTCDVSRSRDILRPGCVSGYDL